MRDLFGGVLGAGVAPTKSSASGMWTMREVYRLRRTDTWPSRPGAPTSPFAAGGDAQATVSWTAPADNGGYAISDYVVQYSSNSGSTWTTFSDGTSTATAAIVTGLTNGTAYVFRVAAVNALGTGPYSSASASVSPTAAVLLPSLSGSLVGIYSTQQRVSGYTGHLMTIRRDSDNATLNVPADYSGVLSWIGSANAYVTVWKDQSGNAADLTAAGSVPFVIAGDSSTGGNAYLQVGSSNYLSGNTASLNGKSTLVLSAAVAPIGSQTAGSNYVNSSIIYFEETGGWGVVALGAYDSSIAWRFGTGVNGNRGALISRASTSNNLAVFTAARFASAVERGFINGTQVGSDYQSSSTISATSNLLAVGNGESTRPNAKVCEILVYVDSASGDAASIASNQMTAFGLS